MVFSAVSHPETIMHEGPAVNVHPLSSQFDPHTLTTPTLLTLLRYVSSEAWAFAPTASNTGELRDMVSNPLDPDLMTAPERLAEAACLLARAILRHRLKAADGRKKDL